MLRDKIRNNHKYFPPVLKRVFCRKQDIDQIVEEHKGFHLVGKKAEGQGCVTLSFKRLKS